MTCIVGLVENGRIYMGGDSCSTAGWDISIISRHKVFRNGPMLMGCTGFSRMCQLVEHAFTPPEHPDGMSIEKYFVTLFADELRACLKGSGIAERESEREKYNGEILVGYRGELITIDSAYGATFVRDSYQSVGSGEYYAKGSMFTSEGFNLSPAKRIEKALEAAAHYSVGVEPPFHIEVLENELAVVSTAA